MNMENISHFGFVLLILIKYHTIGFAEGIGKFILFR